MRLGGSGIAILNESLRGGPSKFGKEEPWLEHPGGNIEDEHRDLERTHPAGSFTEQNRMLLGGRVETADTRSDKNADLVSIRLFQVQAGVEQSLMAGHHGELGETIGPADFFR